MAPERPGDSSAGPDDGGASGGDGHDGGESDDAEALLRELHGHLAATAELPVETGAGRWLGEAEAVAADVAQGEAPRSAIETRVRQVQELLSHVEGTGNPAADEHVEAARELVAEIERAIDHGP